MTSTSATRPIPRTPPRSTDDFSGAYGRPELTHGIRGILWHQGENDQGADGPTGGFGWETYEQFFIEMSAGWKQDYPNVQHYYVFQIWPKACAMGVNGSDNMLREVQRTLPTLYSRMSIMSTLGIKPPGGCHYPLAGWAEFARLIQPLIERDIYGKVSSESHHAAQSRAGRLHQRRRRTPSRWSSTSPSCGPTPSSASSISMEKKAKVTSGSVTGNVLTLKLTGPSTAQRITYLDSKSWNPNNLLYGANGIAALTFCEVPIDDASFAK